MGEELGARGEKEGSGREKEEGDGEDLPLLALHPPAPRSSGEREGAPCIPIFPRAGLRPQACVLLGTVDRSCLCPRSLSPCHLLSGPTLLCSATPISNQLQLGA